jgi:hypothetical protein
MGTPLAVWVDAAKAWEVQSTKVAKQAADVAIGGGGGGGGKASGGGAKRRKQV